MTYTHSKHAELTINADIVVFDSGEIIINDIQHVMIEMPDKQNRRLMNFIPGDFEATWTPVQGLSLQLQGIELGTYMRLDGEGLNPKFIVHELQLLSMEEASKTFKENGCLVDLSQVPPRIYAVKSTVFGGIQVKWLALDDLEKPWEDPDVNLSIAMNTQRIWCGDSIAKLIEKYGDNIEFNWDAILDAHLNTEE